MYILIIVWNDVFMWILVFGFYFQYGVYSSTDSTIFHCIQSEFINISYAIYTKRKYILAF